MGFTNIYIPETIGMIKSDITYHLQKHPCFRSSGPENSLLISAVHPLSGEMSCKQGGRKASSLAGIGLGSVVLSLTS